MGPWEHDKYFNYILPRHPRDCSFVLTVETLEQIFSEHTSLFNAWFNCQYIPKWDTVDFTFTVTVNKECQRFKISSITDDQFKCLIFVCGLRSARYKDVRTRILSKIEQNPDIPLQKAAEECQRQVNLKHDSDMVQQSVSTINTIQRKQYSTSLSSTQKEISTRLLELCWLAFCKKMSIQNRPLPRTQPTKKQRRILCPTGAQNNK